MPVILSNDTNNKKLKAAGYCTISDPGGDQAYLFWQGESDGMPGHPTRGTFEYLGGTGQYQQISGQNTFAGVQQINWQDGTASGYSIWNR
jgi:hypothetical protein